PVQLLLDHGRRARGEHPGRDLLSLADDGAGGDHAPRPDPGPLEDDRAHPDERAVLDHAALEHRAVADRDVAPDNRRQALRAVDHGVVLDARPVADLDPVEVAAEHGPEPDARAGADGDVPDQRGARCDEDAVGDVGHPPVELVQWHQRPVNSGGRRSRAARTPSPWSSVPTSRLCAIVSAGIPLVRAGLAASSSRRFVSPYDWGARRNASRASRDAAAASSPSGTTSVSRPTSCARRASIVALPRRRSRARARPTSLTSRATPPWVGSSPSRPSVNAKPADAAATRRSHASASWTPRPTATPFTAAITGFSTRSSRPTRSVRRWLSKRKAAWSTGSPNRSRSAPAQNAGPLPVRTSAWTPSSRAARTSSSCSAAIIRGVSAFRASGRASVIVRTPSESAAATCA